MYAYSLENYKKYIAKFYNNIIILFLVISWFSYFVINTNLFGVLGTISLATALILFVYKECIKFNCKNYDLNIFKNAITFQKKTTISNETQDTVFYNNYEILIYKGISNIEEFKQELEELKNV